MSLPRAQTPNAGPWRYEESTHTVRTSPANNWLATLDSWDGLATPHNTANGHLMAAAPDMQAAILKVLDGLEAWRDDAARNLYRCEVEQEAKFRNMRDNYEALADTLRKSLPLPVFSAE